MLDRKLSDLAVVRNEQGADRTSTICAPPAAALPNGAAKSYGGFSSLST